MAPITAMVNKSGHVIFTHCPNLGGLESIVCSRVESECLRRCSLEDIMPLRLRFSFGIVVALLAAAGRVLRVKRPMLA